MPKCRCGCTAPHQAPRIWSDKALAEWATPIAPLGVRPGHFTEAEYYAAPLTDVQTYPVYRPDKEPAGYWDWLQRQTPRPLVEVGVARTAEQWIKDGEAAFRALDHPAFRTNDPELIRKYRDLKSYADVWTQPDGTLLDDRWVVTQRGVGYASEVLQTKVGHDVSD